MPIEPSPTRSLTFDSSQSTHPLSLYPLKTETDSDRRSSDLVAIRSDVDLKVEEFETANPQYRTPKIRLIAPPRAPLMLAEHHGAFEHVDPERSWQWVEGLFLRSESGIDLLLPDFAVVGLVVFPLTEPGAPSTFHNHGRGPKSGQACSLSA